jgi:hypothetical protein
MVFPAGMDVFTLPGTRLRLRRGRADTRFSHEVRILDRVSERRFGLR